MKTQLRKYAVIGAMLCAMPFAAFAQDQPMGPADAGDTTISPQDAQLDSAEAQQVAPPDQAQAPVSTQNFYDDLSPYGQWVTMPNYGYVWIPSAGVGFTPYSTNGHWVYTEYGWTWVSDYSWGWAPFHYGRWQYDADYGWFWIPDVTWGPAWVCWRHCDGYYGWAPLGWGMNISIGYYGDYGIPDSWWMFCGDRYITDRHISRYYLPRDRSEYLYHHSSVIPVTRYDNAHHIAYAAGPGRQEVAAVTHSNIRQVEVRPTNTPTQRYDNQHLHTYKPEVQNNDKAAPARSIPENQVPKRSTYTNGTVDHTTPQRSAPQQQQRSAPQQQRSVPVPQQHYAPIQRSAPVRSAPARSAPSGGGGRGGRR